MFLRAKNDLISDLNRCNKSPVVSSSLNRHVGTLRKLTRPPRPASTCSTVFPPYSILSSTCVSLSSARAGAFPGGGLPRPGPADVDLWELVGLAGSLNEELGREGGLGGVRSASDRGFLGATAAGGAPGAGSYCCVEAWESLPRLGFNDSWIADCARLWIWLEAWVVFPPLGWECSG